MEVHIFFSGTNSSCGVYGLELLLGLDHFSGQEVQTLLLPTQELTPLAFRTQSSFAHDMKRLGSCCHHFSPVR